MKKLMIVLLIICAVLLCGFSSARKLTEKEKQLIDNFFADHEVSVRLFDHEISEQDGEAPTLVVPFTVLVDGLTIEGGYAFIDLNQDVLDHIFDDTTQKNWL